MIFVTKAPVENPDRGVPIQDLRTLTRLVAPIPIPSILTISLSILSKSPPVMPSKLLSLMRSSVVTTL